MLLKRFLLGVLLAGLVTIVSAAPQLLLPEPLPSADNKHAANVEWDTAGFIGRIRFLIYTNSEKPSAVVELPQIKPTPANLVWITDDWVACESFVAESGAAFVYMNVARNRAYMLEIFAPEDDGDWMISYTTNDDVSSSSIQTISKGHSSLFPILLRDLPQTGLAYLTPDFPFLLGDAVDSFVDWRAKQGFKELKAISEVARDPSLGQLVIADVDSKAEIVYFPQGTTTTREMLALTQRKPLPDTVQKLINGLDPPRLVVEWTDTTGSFHVMAQRDDDASSGTELVAGKFEGVTDSVYSGPGVEALVEAAPAASPSTDKSEKASAKSDGEKSSSKPSASKSKAITGKSGSKSITIGKKSSSGSSSKSSSSKSSSKSKSGKSPSRSN